MRLNIVIIFLLFILIFLQYRLWFEPGSLWGMLKFKREVATQSKKNETLKNQNNELMLQVKRLQNSQEIIESRARDELGMIKKGEVFYRTVRIDKETNSNENLD